MNSTREIAASDTRGVRRFVALERDLVGSHPLFYTEMDADILKQLSGASAFFKDTRYALFVASSGSTDVGRCVALINPRYQQGKGDAAGCVGYFAAAPDQEQAIREMLRQAEVWLSERGVRRVVAPYNGSIFTGFVGLRTSNFEDEPCYPFGWHPPYYAQYLLAAGYTKKHPMMSFEIDFSSAPYRAMAARAVQNTQVQVRPLNKGQWSRELETVRTMLNETFKDEWEYVPTTQNEFREVLDSLKPILDPRLLLIAEADGHPAGFCWGLPDWAPLFRSMKGRLGPFQMVKLLVRAGSYRRAGLIMIGVLPEQRGKGVAQSLAVTLYRRYEEKGLRGAFYHLVNENNLASRRFAESMGAKGRTLYHGFEKLLLP